EYPDGTHEIVTGPKRIILVLLCHLNAKLRQGFDAQGLQMLLNANNIENKNILYEPFTKSGTTHPSPGSD
ncbi:hypothetical protein STEG23_018597, partial [Scotinomys teguina]